MTDRNIAACDQWWIDQLADVELRARDVASCRVAYLLGNHDDRYRGVRRKMVGIVDQIAALRREIARMT